VLIHRSAWLDHPGPLPVSKAPAFGCTPIICRAARSPGACMAKTAAAYPEQARAKD
jgi:hypothetical protein